MKLHKHSHLNQQLQLRVGLNTKSYEKLWDLDTSFIGTKDYMGFAYFWDGEVKHTMRDLSALMRKVIHDTALEEELFEEYYSCRKSKPVLYVPTSAKLIQIINATLRRYKPKDYETYLMSEEQNCYKVRKDIGEK